MHLLLFFAFINAISLVHLHLLLALFYNYPIDHSLSYFYSIHFQCYFYNSALHIYDLFHYFTHSLNWDCTFIYDLDFINFKYYLISFYFEFILGIDSELEQLFFIIIFICCYDLQIMSTNDCEILSIHY